MSESEKKEKKSGSGIAGWWKNLKAEFGKIIWPDRPTIVKETTAVVIVSVILGIIIKLVDMLVQLGIDKILS